MYKPNQKCMVINSGTGDAIGTILVIKSTRTAEMDAFTCKFFALFRGAKGLLAQEVYPLDDRVPEDSLCVWPISWMVPIDENPDQKEEILDKELEFIS